MRKLLKTRFCLLTCFAVAGLVVVGSINRADARTQYKKAFEKKYPDLVKKHGKKGKLTCNVCHEGKSKKKHNVYGETLKTMISKKEKDTKKIDEALTKGEKEKSAIKDKTFGDVIKDGKLPASKE